MLFFGIELLKASRPHIYIILMKRLLFVSLFRFRAGSHSNPEFASSSLPCPNLLQEDADVLSKAEPAKVQPSSAAEQLL